MKSFIFNKQPAPFPELCDSTPFSDLVVHLQNSGVTEIFSDTDENVNGVIRCSFSDARKLWLGAEWLAAYSGCVTRQSPVELRDRTQALGADVGISLAPSAKPWEYTTILTDGDGFVEEVEKNPSPENTQTNLCFSNLAWIASDEFDPGNPLGNSRTSTSLLPGYWKCPDSRENFLLTVHDVMCGNILPWPHVSVPDTGRILRSPAPANTVIRGTLWLGRNCHMENGCILENCVILDGASIGKNSNLRNCLVIPGATIPENTFQHEKYLSLLGDDNGREY